MIKINKLIHKYFIISYLNKRGGIKCTFFLYYYLRIVLLIKKYIYIYIYAK